MAFSPDSTCFASAGADGTDTIRVWNATTGHATRCLSLRSEISSIAFSPLASHLILLGRDHTLRTFDLATARQEVVARQDDLPITIAAVSPEGRIAAFVNKATAVNLCDASTGNHTASFPGPCDAITSIKFSADGRFLTFAGKQVLYIWSLDKRKELTRLELEAGSPQNAALSPDARLLAVPAQDRIILIDLLTLKQVSPAGGHEGKIFALAYSSAGALFASGSDDGSLRLWNLQTAEQNKCIRMGSGVHSLTIDEGAKFLAAGCRDGIARLWAAHGTGPLVMLQTDEGPETRSPLNCVAFSPSGHLLASGDTEGAIRLWDVASGRQLNGLAGHRSQVLSLAFSPDGRILASTGGYTGRHLTIEDRTLRLWNVETRRELTTGVKTESTIPAVAFSPEGDMLAIGGDLLLLKWRERRESGRLSGPRHGVSSLAFSPNGFLLATAARQASLFVIQVWELRTGQEVCRFTGHEGTITSLCFLPGGTMLASGGADTTILVWDITLGKLARNGQMKETQQYDVDALWRDLASTESPRAYSAMWALQSLEGESVAFLSRRLKRVPSEEGLRVARLVEKLDDEDFAVREGASVELQRLGVDAEQLVTNALDTDRHPEARRRLERLLEYSRAAPWSAGALQRSRAVEVLEHIGSADAREVLRALTQGCPAALLTTEAQAALARLRNEKAKGTER
jgi:WD40 repeat protein